MECVGHPLDEFAILAAAICTGKHVGIMLNAMEFWTSREDSDWEKCDIYFAYIGDEVFIPIERLDMSLLNRVAQRVSLGDTSCVRPKRGRKKKIVTPTEETTTGVKELKNGIGKQKAKEFKANIIEAESSEPKRRGRKRKNNDESSKQERKDVVKGKTKGRKEKKIHETLTAETLERGHKPPIQENENVVKRKRGRPKKSVITDNINNDDDDADVFCEPHKPKRKLYNRESKSKGRVFIKGLTGKNRNGKKGKKHDLETELNDIDIMIKNMGMAEMSIVGDSNVEQCNLQVASTHQTEEGNKEHKELYQRNLEEIEDDIVTDGVVTFGVGGSKENEEFTDGVSYRHSVLEDPKRMRNLQTGQLQLQTVLEDPKRMRNLQTGQLQTVLEDPKRMRNLQTGQLQMALEDPKRMRNLQTGQLQTRCWRIQRE